MRFVLGVAAVLVAGTAYAAPGEFVVRPGGDSHVVFVSKATVESFEGKTGKLSGRLTLDPANVGDSATVHFEVDMASLDTGIARRNQHMRENHLETAKFPTASFDGATLLGPAGPALASGKPTALDVQGTFTLHGVSRRMRISVEATYDARPGGSRIAFNTRFPITLSDYDISLPQFLFLKLAQTQDVRVSGVAVGSP